MENNNKSSKKRKDRADDSINYEKYTSPNGLPYSKKRKTNEIRASSVSVLYGDAAYDHFIQRSNQNSNKISLRSYEKWATKLIIRERAKTIEETQILMQPVSSLSKMMSKASSSRESLSQTDSEERMKHLELVFKAMNRIAELGFLLTYEQSVIINAMIRAHVPKILGEHMVVHLGTLMKKHRMTSFRAILAVRFGRRRGKSKAVGYFHAIMLATQPKFFGMIMNLDQDLAKQNLKYAAGFIEMLQNDPEHVINCKLETMGKNEMSVRSVHGTINSLFAAPDITRLKGVVSKYIYSIANYN